MMFEEFRQKVNTVRQLPRDMVVMLAKQMVQQRVALLREGLEAATKRPPPPKKEKKGWLGRRVKKPTQKKTSQEPIVATGGSPKKKKTTTNFNKGVRWARNRLPW